MTEEALLHHVLVVGVTIVGEGFDGDAAAWIEQADDLQIFGVHKLDEIFHDNIHAVFMKITMVAEAEKVELQALALHHQRTRDVIDNDMPKVRLARLGTKRGELRTVERHQIVVLRVFVLEGLQHLRRIVIAVLGVLVSQQRDAF